MKSLNTYINEKYLIDMDSEYSEFNNIEERQTRKNWSINNAEDGDIVNWNHTGLYFIYKCLNSELKKSIEFKGGGDNVIIYHASYNIDSKSLDIGPTCGVGDISKPNLYRLADIETAKEFLEVLKDKGYEWDENKKELVKI